MIMEPPPDYVYANRHMEIRHYSKEQLMAFCGGGACAILGKKHCIIMLPNPNEVSGWIYAYYKRHEMAHCNGWKH
jgi:hypothetical protein